MKENKVRCCTCVHRQFAPKRFATCYICLLDLTFETEHDGFELIECAKYEPDTKDPLYGEF